MYLPICFVIPKMRSIYRVLHRFRPSGKVPTLLVWRQETAPELQEFTFVIKMLPQMQQTEMFKYMDKATNTDPLPVNTHLVIIPKI